MIEQLEFFRSGQGYVGRVFDDVIAYLKGIRDNDKIY